VRGNKNNRGINAENPVGIAVKHQTITRRELARSSTEKCENEAETIIAHGSRTRSSFSTRCRTDVGSAVALAAVESVRFCARKASYSPS
jgi:hypothetical protein